MSLYTDPKKFRAALLAEAVALGLPELRFSDDELRRAFVDEDSSTRDRITTALLQHHLAVLRAPTEAISSLSYGYETKRKYADPLLRRLLPETVHVNLHAEVRALTDRELLDLAEELGALASAAPALLPQVVVGALSS